MKNSLLLLFASLALFTQPVLSQTVTIAGLALGMNEADVKTALASHSPFYADQDSNTEGLHYLVAESEEESFALTFIDGKLAGFSTMHLLPPGQQAFLPAGQDPTVNTLRNLLIKRTWTPAMINKGDSFWLSDAAGKPISNPSKCDPKLGMAWLPYGPIAASTPGQTPPKSTTGLMKPVISLYPSGCGISIRLNMMPAGSENDRVNTVRIQVLDIKAINEFASKQAQH